MPRRKDSLTSKNIAAAEKHQKRLKEIEAIDIEIDNFLHRFAEYKSVYFAPKEDHITLEKALRKFFDHLEMELKEVIEGGKDSQGLVYAIILEGLPSSGKTHLYVRHIKPLIQLIKKKVELQYPQIEFNIGFNNEYIHWDNLEDILKERIEQLEPYLEGVDVEQRFLGMAHALLAYPLFVKEGIFTIKAVIKKLKELKPQSGTPYQEEFLKITRWFERYLILSGLTYLLAPNQERKKIQLRFFSVDKPGGNTGLVEEEPPSYFTALREYDAELMSDLLLGKEEFRGAQLDPARILHIPVSPGPATSVLGLKRDLENKAPTPERIKQIAEAFGVTSPTPVEWSASKGGGSYEQVQKSRDTTNQVIKTLVGIGGLPEVPADVIDFILNLDHPNFFEDLSEQIVNLKDTYHEGDQLHLPEYNLLLSEKFTSKIMKAVQNARWLQKSYPVTETEMAIQTAFDLAGAGMQLQISRGHRRHAQSLVDRKALGYYQAAPIENDPHFLIDEEKFNALFSSSESVQQSRENI